MSSPIEDNASEPAAVSYEGRRDFFGNNISEQGSQKRTCAHSVENPAQIGCVKIE
jgi:hypothetical protein